MSSVLLTASIAPPPETPLAQLSGLIVDVQTTGASPRHGSLIEVAWARVTPDGDSYTLGEVTEALVAPPRGARIPRVVSELTGLTSAQLKRARPPRRSRGRLG